VLSALSSIELCTGAGCAAVGLESAGFEHAVLVENDADAATTLRVNRPRWKVHEGDIREFDAVPYRGIDLVSGGVPCQPFSIGGKQLGENDERNLFPDALRIIAEALPRAIMLENVKGVFDPRFGQFRENVQTVLAMLGYRIWWQTEYAHNHGVPQYRPRAVLIGIRAPWAERFTWPRHFTVPPTAGEALYPLMAERGWCGAQDWARHRCTKIAPTLVGGSKKHGGPDLGPTRARAAWAALGVNGGSVALEAPGEDEPHGHTPRLTVRMGARLQGFPHDWTITGNKTAQWRQVGNAFPAPVARDLGEMIRRALSG
jgi:DNA (cytosine-5)-methyltransferase 1